MEYNILVSPYQKNTVDTQLYFKQNDYGITLSITVEDYDTSGTTAKIVFRRSDGVVREYNIEQSADGTYKYNLSADEIYSPGKVIVDLKFYKQGVRESTASFIYNVISDKVGETFASGDYSDSIARAIESCNQAIANIQEQANQAIEDVENALLAELNVYDGYDKTTIGFAADARQLNENVANSYAAKVKEKIDTNTNLINALNNNLTQSANGKFILPNGLKIQWGMVTIPSVDANSSANGETQSFSTPYINVPIVSITSLDVQCVTYCGGVDKNVVIPSCRNLSAQARPNVKLHWIAIGY